MGVIASKDAGPFDCRVAVLSSTKIEITTYAPWTSTLFLQGLFKPLSIAGKVDHAAPLFLHSAVPDHRPPE